MRLDKFLKVSRIIKRRPVAKMVIDNGKVSINSKVAKAGTEVKLGDVLEVEYYSRYIKVEIVEIPKGNVGKDQAGELIKVLETKRIEVEEEDILGEL